MLKFIAQRGDRKLLGLGLSKRNLELLEAGKPISFSGEQVSLDGLDILILYGETEDDIQRELEENCQCPAAGHIH